MKVDSLLGSAAHDEAKTSRSRAAAEIRINLKGLGYEI